MTYPKCFNSEKEWKAWVVLARRTRLVDPCLSFCLDCSVAYRDDMIAEGRCEYPDTYFETVLNEDEEIERRGVRNARD